MNPRKSIEELELQGSPNLGRSLKRLEAEKGQPAEPLTESQQSEVAQLDELIAQSMRACRKGSTVDGKRNPAYANLALLVKTRKELISGGGKRKDNERELTPMERLEAAVEKVRAN
jgi:hypothetical protein